MPAYNPNLQPDNSILTNLRVSGRAAAPVQVTAPNRTTFVKGLGDAMMQAEANRITAPSEVQKAADMASATTRAQLEADLDFKKRSLKELYPQMTDAEIQRRIQTRTADDRYFMGDTAKARRELENFEKLDFYGQQRTAQTIANDDDFWYRVGSGQLDEIDRRSLNLMKDKILTTGEAQDDVFWNRVLSGQMDEEDRRKIGLLRQQIATQNQGAIDLKQKQDRYSIGPDSRAAFEEQYSRTEKLGKLSNDQKVDLEERLGGKKIELRMQELDRLGDKEVEYLGNRLKKQYDLQKDFTIDLALKKIDEVNPRATAQQIASELQILTHKELQKARQKVARSTANIAQDAARATGLKESISRLIQAGYGKEQMEAFNNAGDDLNALQQIFNSISLSVGNRAKEQRGLGQAYVNQLNAEVEEASMSMISTINQQAAIINADDKLTAAQKKQKLLEVYSDEMYKVAEAKKRRQEAIKMTGTMPEVITRAPRVTGRGNSDLPSAGGFMDQGPIQAPTGGESTGQNLPTGNNDPRDPGNLW